MSNEKEYTWAQIEEALSAAGITDSSKVQKVLSESAVNYSSTADEGPDPEGQEKLEPRAPAEKAWADRHTIQVFDPMGPEYEDGTDKMNQATFPSSATAPKAETTVSFDRIRRMMS